MYKNIDKQIKLRLTDLVDYRPGQRGQSTTQSDRKSKAGRTAVLAFAHGLGLKLLCMIRLFAFLRFFYTLE